MVAYGGKAQFRLGVLWITKPLLTLNVVREIEGVRLREISSVVERERAQTNS